MGKGAEEACGFARGGPIAIVVREAANTPHLTETSGLFRSGDERQPTSP